VVTINDADQRISSQRVMCDKKWEKAMLVGTTAATARQTVVCTAAYTATIQQEPAACDAA
jgi:hypothetical protein